MNLPHVVRSRMSAAAAIAALVVWAAASPLAAQAPAAAPVVVTVAPVTLTAGGKAETKVTLEILRGFRIIAPGTEGKFLQPAQLAFNAADGVFVEPPAWPAGKEWRDPDGPSLRIYEGKVEFTMTVRAGANVSAQELALSGRLRYQSIYFDDYQKPATLVVRLPVAVTTSPAAAPKAKPPAATRP